MQWPWSLRRVGYSLAPDDEPDRARTEHASHITADQSRRVTRVCSCGIVAVIIFLGLFVTWNDSFHDWAPPPNQPSYLIFLVPAQDASVGLCKTLASSAALGYPPPNLIRMEGDYSDVSGISAAHEIIHMFDYLAQLEPHNDDSLVLIVEGASSYFQLRPDVLISRYLDVNHAANQRIYSQLGRAMLKESVWQSILFAARPQCLDEQSSGSQCLMAPSGSGDTMSHHLQSHAMIGPVRDLRALFQRAKQKAEDAIERNVFVSSDAIFAEIYAEQEVARVRTRGQHNAWLTAWFDHWTFFSSSRDAIEAGKLPGTNILNVDGAYEFGIGLDHAGSIFSPSTSAHTHDFFSHSDPFATLSPTTKSKQALSRASLSALADPALRGSKPPFQTSAQGRNATHLPAPNTSWADVPLFTDKQSGIAPVTVPLAFKPGPLSSADPINSDGWRSSWFARNGRLRPLLRAHALSPVVPLARLPLPRNAQPYDPLSQTALPLLSAYEDSSPYFDSRKREPKPLREQLVAYAATLSLLKSRKVWSRGEPVRMHEWWPAGLQREGAHVVGGADVQWRQLCGADDEVWGDGGGEWRDVEWWPE